jgi:hypothetical protein
VRVTKDAVFDKETAMPPALNRNQVTIECNIGPHGARPDWRVLRVTYLRCPEHERRVAQALDALIAPVPLAERPQASDADPEEKVRDGVASV